MENRVILACGARLKPTSSQKLGSLGVLSKMLSAEALRVGGERCWEPLGIFSGSGPNGATCPLITTGLAKHQSVMRKCTPGPCVTGSASGRVLVPKTGAKGIPWDSGAGANMCQLVS